MKNEFKVRPVSTYSGARYPSTWYRPPAEEEEQKKHPPLHILLALVLVMGLALGVIGCFAEYKSDPCALGLLPKNPDGSCNPPDPDDECIAGLNWCDNLTLYTCKDDGSGWTDLDCDAYCQETLGFGGYAVGCDTREDEPCQCEYDIIAGEMTMCTPGDIVCRDENTLATCDQQGVSWNEQDCDTWCTDTFGEDYYATECDDTDEDNICGCEYGIVDGGMGGP
jgi:hypothetical protein